MLPQTFSSCCFSPSTLCRCPVMVASKIPSFFLLFLVIGLIFQWNRRLSRCMYLMPFYRQRSPALLLFWKSKSSPCSCPSLTWNSSRFHVPAVRSALLSKTESVSRPCIQTRVLVFCSARMLCSLLVRCGKDWSGCRFDVWDTS